MQERLNHVMILNVLNKLVDAIDLTDIAKELASANESRQQETIKCNVLGTRV